MAVVINEFEVLPQPEPPPRPAPEVAPGDDASSPDPRAEWHRTVALWSERNERIRAH